MSIEKSRYAKFAREISQKNQKLVSIDDYSVDAAVVRVSVIIEPRTLFRECLSRAVFSNFGDGIAAFSSVDEWLDASDGVEPSIVLLSVGSLFDEQGCNDVTRAVVAALDAPVVVMTEKGTLADAQKALELNAKGLIAADMEVEATARALKFVSLGGVFVPAECLLFASATPLACVPSSRGAEIFTARELSILRAVRLGKLNKTIAYELNMCESTVKVHVRNIMKKLHARNRTEVAVKAQDMMRLDPTGELSQADGA